MPLSRLIEDCKHNDRKAQRKLYEQFAPSMLSLCMRYLGERETARDALQEGFVKVFSKIDSYGASGSFEGWIRRIFVNTALEILRKQKREIDITFTETITDADNLAFYENTMFEGLSADDLMQMIAELPPAYRTVFNLRTIEGYEYNEIAQQLDVTETTLRSQFMRARQMLKEKVLYN